MSDDPTLPAVVYRAGAGRVQMLVDSRTVEYPPDRSAYMLVPEGQFLGLLEAAEHHAERCCGCSHDTEDLAAVAGVFSTSDWCPNSDSPRRPGRPLVGFSRRTWEPAKPMPCGQCRGCTDPSPEPPPPPDTPTDGPSWWERRGTFTDAPKSTLDTLELDPWIKALADEKARRMAAFGALEELCQLAVRDGRDVVVTQRDAVVQDAWVTRSPSDDPTVYWIDEGQLGMFTRCQPELSQPWGGVQWAM